MRRPIHARTGLANRPRRTDVEEKLQHELNQETKHILSMAD